MRKTFEKSDSKVGRKRENTNKSNSSERKTDNNVICTLSEMHHMQMCQKVVGRASDFLLKNEISKRITRH